MKKFLADRHAMTDVLRVHSSCSSGLGPLNSASRIAGTEKQISHYGGLPESLISETLLAEKLRRDQQKLLAMVEYARCETDRREFLNNYFLGTTSAE
ncbi:MAG: hypothetical protein ACJ0BJ_12500 [Pirellulales bacterium]